jgi:hypothetical protein
LVISSFPAPAPQDVGQGPLRVMPDARQGLRLREASHRPRPLHDRPRFLHRIIETEEVDDTAVGDALKVFDRCGTVKAYAPCTVASRFRLGPLGRPASATSAACWDRARSRTRLADRPRLQRSPPDPILLQLLIIPIRPHRQIRHHYKPLALVVKSRSGHTTGS